ncbi:MAG: xanthine dehydrogenase family protein subunit M [Bacteroidales bacterium]|jgi:carbon-monoxide dehydrogenase medium subunit|nr:xanthine dehydrogenase family protein subunit M [Bacteroidales bacterium]
MVLPDFGFYQPISVKDAIDLLMQKPNAAAMAGGTDLLVEMKNGIRRSENLVSLAKIPEMKFIKEDVKNLFIGACTTHSEVIASPLIGKFAPALVEAASKIGSNQIRNTGTIGGNICTAASCCDSAPILLALNASVEIAGTENIRVVPLRDFFTFNKKTILKKGELVTRIIVPKSEPGIGACYEKFGLREAGSIAVVSVAAKVQLVNDICVDACIVIGAVAPTPKISGQATTVLKGKKVSEFAEDLPLLEEAGNAAVRDSIPIDDIRGGAQYRRDVLKVLVKRTIRRAFELAVNNEK